MEEIVTGTIIGVIGAVATEKAFPQFSKGCRNIAKSGIKTGLGLGFFVKKTFAGTFEYLKDVYAEAKYEFAEKKENAVTIVPNVEKAT